MNISAASNDRTLSISRTISAPRGIVWRCWTEPALLAQWYCPRPLRVTMADIDVRPGGRANVTMQGPDGPPHEHAGVYLEVIPQERLTFTDAMTEGFMPGAGKPFMVGYVVLSDWNDGGTMMEWGARHWLAEDRKAHEEMGFDKGWNAAADQLIELARSLAAETAA